MSAALTSSESPRCVTRPVTKAATFNSLAAFCGSVSLAVYLITETSMAHDQIRKLGETADQAVGQSVTQVLGVRIRGDASEGQNRKGVNRRFGTPR